MKPSKDELIVYIALGYGALIILGSIIGFFARLGQKGSESLFNRELRKKLEETYSEVGGERARVRTLGPGDPDTSEHEHCAGQ